MNEIAVEDAQDTTMPPPDVDVEQVERVARRARPRRPRDLEPVERESKPMAELRDSEDRSLSSWLRELSPSGAVRVRVERKDPPMWKGFNVGGIVGRYEEMIDDSVIEARHGGGTYVLNVRKPNGKGGWQFAGERTIKIAGDPRTDDVYRTPEPAPPPPPPVAVGPSQSTIEMVMRSNERFAEMARQSGNNGLDIETVRTMMAPLQTQLEQMAALLRAKDEQLAIAQAPRPPERDEFRDRMMDKLLDGESARITALRSQFESELRQVKQSAMDNESRLRDSFDRDKQALTMSHEREIRSIESAHAMSISALNQSAAVTKQLLEAEIIRLQSDKAEDKAEIAALRAKKEMTPMEALKVADEIREMAGGGNGEKSGWDKFAEVASAVAANNPAVQGAIAKVIGGEQAPQAPQQQLPLQQPARPAKLLTGPDGHLYRQLPTGALELVRKRAAPPVQPGQAAIPPIPIADLKQAVSFLENAYRNNQDPIAVATSVRSMVPGEVLAAIRELGIEAFLTNVAKLDATSQLASQAGRNWTRRLGKALVGE